MTSGDPVPMPKTDRRVHVPRTMTLAAGLIAALALSLTTRAQDGSAQGTPAATAKASAPIDITGYWVSLIVDEFRHRVAPQKGDLLFIPINAEATRIAKEWDPDATANKCKAYGGVGLFQRPGRLHIVWADDRTIRIDADAGTQTRLLQFDSTDLKTRAPSLQGTSMARWEFAGGRGGRGAATRSGSLTVVTRNLLPGYIRKNGVPHSGDARLTEYFSVLTGPENQPYLAVTATVDDPRYLTEPFTRTYIFKKLPDGSGWDPTPCWPR
jgi:hypothetical protein